MSPSSCIPIVAANENWTDEAIFLSLFDFKRGKPLPQNITSDVNPYQYNPSDLPAGLWYLWSGVKDDAECGSWKETGASCETFSNSAIIGSKTTLQFYEGQASNNRKTEWMMQEYRITEKWDNNTKDLRALYRVFLASTDFKISQKAVLASGHVGKTPDPFADQSEMDCILRGDYFELNDLIDPGSRSSSSANSSCLTMTSDEYFDSIALLQEIENDNKDWSVKFKLSAPLKSTEVFIRAAPSVPLITDQDSKRTLVQETTNDCKSSGISKDTPKDGKKERVSNVKRGKMKYLCFLAF